MSDSVKRSEWEHNIRLFVAFRILFHARFYYPVFTFLFLDLGISLAEFSMLNVAWAVTIMLTEVPSGALADLIGRKRLLVLAALGMVVEMLCLLLCFLLPPALILPLMLVNRIISGFSEALSSGADEALVYDSLAEHGEEGRWEQVLARLMRWQSLATLVAMLSGAVLYDHDLAVMALEPLGLPVPSESFSHALPVALCLISAIFCVFVSLRFREQPRAREERPGIGETWRQAWKTAVWMLTRRWLAFVLLIYMLYDSVVRMFLTISAEFYRLLGVMEALLGPLGAMMAINGLILPVLAKALLGRTGPVLYTWILGVYLLVMTYAISQSSTLLGLVPALALAGGMYFLNYWTSVVINRSVPSDKRATALSVRGLCGNLSYGLAGVLYAVVTTSLVEDGLGRGEVYFGALQWFAPCLAGGIVILFLLFGGVKPAWVEAKES